MLKTVEKQPRKIGAPNPMTPAARAEHAVVAQALHHVIGPRLKPDVSQKTKNKRKSCSSLLINQTEM